MVHKITCLLVLDHTGVKRGRVVRGIKLLARGSIRVVGIRTWDNKK